VVVVVAVANRRLANAQFQPPRKQSESVLLLLLPPPPPLPPVLVVVVVVIVAAVTTLRVPAVATLPLRRTSSRTRNPRGWPRL
jgi:hypothetical protein